MAACGARFCRKSDLAFYMQQQEDDQESIKEVSERPQSPISSNHLDSEIYGSEAAPVQLVSRFRIKAIRLRPAAVTSVLKQEPVKPEPYRQKCIAEPEPVESQPESESEDLEPLEENHQLNFEREASEAATSISDDHWQVSISGLDQLCTLAEHCEDCGTAAREYAALAYRRVAELVRGPRSHACRAACKAAGRLFTSLRDTRRPGFDDISSALLSKCADASNKFVAREAHAALDALVSSVSPYQAVRALCAAASVQPWARSDAVRAALARLLCAAVRRLSPALVLGPAANPSTRRRLLEHLAKFLADRSGAVRSHAQKMLALLHDEPGFHEALAGCDVELPTRCC